MTEFVDRPLIYLAGPYTRPDPVMNTNRMVKEAERLHATGLVTCHVPHLSLLWHVIAPHEDVDFWYKYDFAVLKRCDAVLRVEGASTGADGEVAFAQENGIPVFFDEDHMLSWAFIRQSEMAELADPC